MPDPLQALAARVVDDPFFLASLLAVYARGETLDEAGLSAALGCSSGDLDMLRLCRAPRSEPTEFQEDIARIAERFGLDQAVLTEVVKRGRVVSALRTAPPVTRGFLSAARDTTEDAPRQSGPEGPCAPPSG